MYRRGLQGQKLQLIVIDGCPGLAAAIDTVYPRAQHQRCWVHKMRNALEHVRTRDYEAVKRDTQAIYQAVYGPMVRNWSVTYRSCSRSSVFHGIYGRSCAPPTSLSAASWRFAGAPGPRCAL
jgi:hypothetical protein